MEVRQVDELEQADEIIQGTSDLFKLLSDPRLPPIPPSVFVVVDVAFEKVMALIGTVLAKEVQDIEEKEK